MTARENVLNSVPALGLTKPVQRTRAPRDPCEGREGRAEGKDVFPPSSTGSQPLRTSPGISWESFQRVLALRNLQLAVVEIDFSAPNRRRVLNTREHLFGISPSWLCTRASRLHVH